MSRCLHSPRGPLPGRRHRCHRRSERSEGLASIDTTADLKAAAEPPAVGLLGGVDYCAVLIIIVALLEPRNTFERDGGNDGANDVLYVRLRYVRVRMCTDTHACMVCVCGRVWLAGCVRVCVLGRSVAIVHRYVAATSEPPVATAGDEATAPYGTEEPALRAEAYIE